MLYTIKSEKITVSADTNGAEIHSIKMGDTEYLWQCGDSWKRYAPVLFPFVCNTSSKKYKAGGVEYTMPSNHGFARDSVFNLVSKDENSVAFELCHSDETLKVYPYEFKLTVKYTVKDNKVIVENIVENPGDKSMYFYLGSHPAFNCPLDENTAFNDYKIVYEKPETIVQSLPDGGKRTIIENENSYAISRELFDFDVILKDMPASKSIALCSDKTDKKVTVNFPMSDCIAVWSPTADNEAKFVCLEAWTSVPVYFDDKYEDIEKKPHAVKLASGSSYTYSYEIVVD